MPDESDREMEQRWSNLVTKAWGNEALKRRLLQEPATVLPEHGIDVRPGFEVRVVENTDKVAYLTLPASPKQGQLSDDELDAVTGGTTSLYQYCCTGKHIPEVKIELVKATTT